MPHAVVSDRQRQRARGLRQTMTRAETLLWRYIKAGRIDGLSFRRQTPLGPFILDFVCFAQRIVIELDGETHDLESRQRADERRSRFLASQGFLVLRFTNADVMSNLSGVVEAIRSAAHALSGGPPSLTLPHKGGGNYMGVPRAADDSTMYANTTLSDHPESQS